MGKSLTWRTICIGEGAAVSYLVALLTHLTSMANFVLLKQVFRRTTRTLLFPAGLKDERKYEIQKKKGSSEALPHTNLLVEIHF